MRNTVVRKVNPFTRARTLPKTTLASKGISIPQAVVSSSWISFALNRLPAMSSKIASKSFIALKLREDGRKLRLHGTSFRVGRAPPCELIVSGPRVSRHHARLVLEGTQWFVEDRDSANGVFLNGRKIDVAQLQVGDVLEFGVRGPEVEVRELLPQPSTLTLETDTDF